MKKDRKVTWTQVSNSREKCPGCCEISDTFIKTLDAEWAKFRADEEKKRQFECVPDVAVIIEKMIPEIDKRIRQVAERGDYGTSFYLDHLDRDLEKYKVKYSSNKIYSELRKYYKSRGYKMDIEMNSVLGFEIWWK